MGPISTALRAATLAAVGADRPDSARDIAARIAGYGFEAVRTALRTLCSEGLVQASGARSHYLYRLADPDDDTPDADEGTAQPLETAPEPPAEPDVAVALEFLQRRGFRVARNELHGFWIVGGQRMSAAAIVTQAEILSQPRSRR